MGDTQELSTSSRESLPQSPLISRFEGYRHVLKDFSKRLEAIKNNPEETYLVNTELTARVLEILENLARSTEKNTVVLERLAGQKPIIQHESSDLNRKRRAREVLAVLERSGPLTYEELRKELKPQVTYKRVTALVSEMIRDGIPLKREGKPVRVSLEENLTGSK